MSFFISVFSFSFFSSFLTLLCDGLTHLHHLHLHQAAVSQTWVHAVAFHSSSSSSSPSVHPPPQFSSSLVFFCLKVFEHQVLTSCLVSNYSINVFLFNPFKRLFYEWSSTGGSPGSFSWSFSIKEWNSPSDTQFLLRSEINHLLNLHKEKKKQ